MKVKLLKKVRKEFKIEYWPNGLPPCEIDKQISMRRGLPVPSSFTDVIRGSCLTLDNKGFKYCFVAIDMERAKNEAFARLTSILRRRYPHLGSYRKKFAKQQIWP